jgi:hypothetical protein
MNPNPINDPHRPMTQSIMEVDAEEDRQRNLYRQSPEYRAAMLEGEKRKQAQIKNINRIRREGQAQAEADAIRARWR